MNARLPTTVGAACLLLGGCVSRHISVTSDPPGATVTVNDVEIGRTPCEAEFTYYGQYDVLVELDGYEPLRTRASAHTPVYEYPPLDLVTMSIPARTDTTIRWHFHLQPAMESVTDKGALEQGVLDRARQLRTQANPPETR